MIHFGAGVVLYCIRLALKLENLLCFSRLWTSAVNVRLPFGPRIEVPFMSSFGRCRVIISGIAWGLFGREFPLPSLTMLRLPERLIIPTILRLGARAGCGELVTDVDRARHMTTRAGSVLVRIK